MADLTLNADDDFTKAFDELSAMGENNGAAAVREAVKPAVADGGEQAASAAAGEQAATGGDGVQAAAVKTPDELAAEAAAAGGEQTTFTGTPDEIAAQEKAAADAAALEAAKPTPTDAALERLAAALEARTEPTAKPVVQQTEQEPALLTSEEISILNAYAKEYPDVARGESLRRKVEYTALVKHVFAEITKELGPMRDMVQELTTRTHLADLQTAAPDYETLRDPVIAWVEKQPAYLQTAYKHVIEHGTKDEVIDLIGRYKAATGAPVTPAPKPAKQGTELPAATKKAVAALAPVSSKRSVIDNTPSPDDFDGAFERFANLE